MEPEETELPSVPNAACIMDAATLQSGQLLDSSDLNSPTDKEGNRAQIPPKGPKKDGQEAQNLKTYHHSQVSLEEASADVHHGVRHSPEPEVERYYYQVNWPQAILQKWAREKEGRERRLNLGMGQDAVIIAKHNPERAPEEQNLAHGEPEDKNGDSWNSTKIALQHSYLEDR